MTLSLFRARALLSAAQAKAADAYSINEAGIPGIVLMEHAGRAVADEAQRMAKIERAVIVTGPGNNGGDGWVAARHLWGRGIPCPVLALRSPAELVGDSAQAAGMFERSARLQGWQVQGRAWHAIHAADTLSAFVFSFCPDVIIDAVFGTGLTRPPAGALDAVLQAVNASGLPVLAVDLPSGLPTDGDAPRGAVVSAARTVTFSRAKIAHFGEPGASLCGALACVDIGLQAPPLEEISTFVVEDAFAPGDDDAAHKNFFGHVAVVEGSAATRGASHLAARAALRMGAGLCTLLTDDPTRVRPAELMARDLSTTDMGDFRAVVVGPGLGSTSTLPGLLQRARAAGCRVVADADALPLLQPGDAAVVTPHPGEAARLLQTTSSDIQRDRLAAARALQQRLGAIVVLKGAVPVVCDAQHAFFIPGYHPALAVAGSGDVLAGAIGALLARGLSPLDAAVLGAVAHQRAGASLGRRGHLATEIADALCGALVARESNR